MKKTDLNSIIETPQSFLVTTTTCPPCRRLKLQFEDLDFPYIEVDTLSLDDYRMYRQFVEASAIDVKYVPTLIEYKDGGFFMFNGDLLGYFRNLVTPVENENS